MANRGQQPSFQTNVHRMQTQRWKDAKNISYDGGDWDAYDEYEEYEEPQPPPKPTGLRQRGQGSVSSANAPTPQKPASPPLQQPPPHHTLRPQGSFEVGDDRRDFSGSSTNTTTGRRPSPTSPEFRSNQHRPSPTSSGPSEQQSRRPSVDPQISRRPSPASPSASSSRRPSADAQIHRSSPVDNRAEFPGPAVRQPSIPRMNQSEGWQPSGVATSNAPAGRSYSPYHNQHPQVQTALSQRPRTSSRGQAEPSLRSGPLQFDPRITHGPSAVEPAGDMQSRRDFGPDGQPPAQSRGPGALPVDPEPLPHDAFPPRKESLRGMKKRPSLSSLGANRRPGSGNQSASPQPPSAPAGDTPTPIVRPPSREDQHTPRFIRPADIYRRVEEERERERQSLDSGRPSLESIDRARRVPSTDSVKDQESNSRLKPTLDTVAERKSEYGMDGFVLQDPSAHPRSNTQLSPEPPSLPQLSRFSGFGHDLLGNASLLNENDSSREVDQTTVEPPRAPGSGMPSQSVDSAASLQHQSSLGFRSAVEQAFDGSTDPSVTSPVSVHSSQRSNEGSEGSRSNADSAAGISPIVSRVPSGAATTAQKARDREIRNATTPSIAEDVNESNSPEPRPSSSSTLRGAPQPATIGHERSFSGDSGSASAKSALRREMNSPSPNNSPAKTPEIQANKEVQKSAEGEIAMTTPVESSSEDLAAPDDATPNHMFQTSFTRRESDLAARARTNSDMENRGVAAAEKQAQYNFMQSHPAGQSMPSLATQDVARTVHGGQRGSSPAKGRVKDLASKYHELHESSRYRRQSPTGSVSSWGSSNVNTPTQSPEKETGTPVASTSSPSHHGPEAVWEDGTPAEGQLLANLAPPRRPRLPGEWISYATAEASDVQSVEPSGSEHYESVGEAIDDRSEVSNKMTPKMTRDESIDLVPTTVKRPLAGKTVEEPLENPMTSLAAAGTALTETLKQSVGLGSNQGEDASDASPRPTPSIVLAAKSSHQGLKPPPTASGPVSSESTVAPTPPAKDTPRQELPPPQQQQRSSGYSPAFPPLTVRNTENPRVEIPQHDRETSASSSQPPSSHLSVDPAYGDTENDRLRKDIVKSLGPSVPSAIHEDPSANKLQLDDRQTSSPRASTVIPHEYESYWEGVNNNESPQDLTKSPTASERHEGLSRSALDERNGVTQTSAPMLGETQFPRPLPNLKRFSWEGPQQQNAGSSAASHTQHPAVSRQVSSPTEYLRQASSPAELGDPASTLRQSSVLNEIDPSPIELADNDSDQERPPMRSDRGDGIARNSSGQLSSRPGPFAPTPSSKDFTSSIQPSPSAPRLPAFQDIMKSKRPSERIQAFQSSRDQFATQDNGLTDWISFMARKHPEHAQVSSASPSRPRPIVTTSGLAGSMRNKIPPSFSKFAKGGGNGEASATSGGQDSAISPQGVSSPSQSRRKELLNSAGAFGGKATTGAKGLLAKGKSRFRPSTEKAQLPSDSQPSHKRRMLFFNSRSKLAEPTIDEVPSGLNLLKYSGEKDAVITNTAVATHSRSQSWQKGVGYNDHSQTSPHGSTAVSSTRHTPSASPLPQIRSGGQFTFSCPISRSSPTHVEVPISDRRSSERTSRGNKGSSRTSRGTSSSGDKRRVSVSGAALKDGSPLVLDSTQSAPNVTKSFINESRNMPEDDSVIEGKWEGGSWWHGADAGEQGGRAANGAQAESDVLAEKLNDILKKGAFDRKESSASDEELNPYGPRGFSIWEGSPVTSRMKQDDFCSSPQRIDTSSYGANALSQPRRLSSPHFGSLHYRPPPLVGAFTTPSAPPHPTSEKVFDSNLGSGVDEANVVSPMLPTAIGDLQYPISAVVSRLSGSEQDAPPHAMTTAQAISQPASQAPSIINASINNAPSHRFSHARNYSDSVSQQPSRNPSSIRPPHLRSVTTSSQLPHRQSTASSLIGSRPTSFHHRPESVSSISNASFRTSNQAQALAALAGPKSLPTDDVRGAHAKQPYREERRRSSDALMALTVEGGGIEGGEHLRRELSEVDKTLNLKDRVEKVEEESGGNGKRTRSRSRNRLSKRPPPSVPPSSGPEAASCIPNNKDTSLANKAKDRPETPRKRSSLLSGIFSRSNKASRLTKPAPGGSSQLDLPSSPSQPDSMNSVPSLPPRAPGHSLGQRFYAADSTATVASIDAPPARPTLPAIGNEEAASLRHFTTSPTTLPHRQPSRPTSSVYTATNNDASFSSERSTAPASPSNVDANDPAAAYNNLYQPGHSLRREHIEFLQEHGILPSRVEGPAPSRSQAARSQSQSEDQNQTQPQNEGARSASEPNTAQEGSARDPRRWSWASFASRAAHGAGHKRSTTSAENGNGAAATVPGKQLEATSQEQEQQRPVCTDENGISLGNAPAGGAQVYSDYTPQLSTPPSVLEKQPPAAGGDLTDMHPSAPPALRVQTGGGVEPGDALRSHPLGAAAEGGASQGRDVRDVHDTAKNRGDESDEEEIVMSPTSGPGEVWMPGSFF